MRTKSSSAESAQTRLAGAFGQLHLVEAAVDQAAVLVGAQVVAADADDASALGQGAVAKGLEQAGMSLRQARSPVPPNRTRSKLIGAGRVVQHDRHRLWQDDRHQDQYLDERLG
jgi:hypothetical protein